MDAINLGQGFPDQDGAPDVRRKAAEALMDASNQYPPSPGLPDLKLAVAGNHYRRFPGPGPGRRAGDRHHLRRHRGADGLDPRPAGARRRGGADRALLRRLSAADPPGRGDFPRFVSLQPPDWRITAEALEQAFSPRTKMLLLNNPLNPSAVVYGEDQLRLVAEACVLHDVIAVCDEVWEHVIFDGRRHVPLISLPGMAERTVKIGSAGKIFSMTGWKVGFACAGPAAGRRPSPRPTPS